MSNDDIIAVGYKYYWSTAHTGGLTLDEYLSKYRPSMVQNDGTKPWIWVKGGDSPTEGSGNKDDVAVKEATALLKEYTKKIDDIKNDDSIPVRSNKKTGARSKKEVREEVQTEASQKLKEIAVKHGYVNGKWLVFAPSDKVDLVWSSLARSLVSGPLAQTKAYLTKVATSPEQEKPGYQHVICVYLPDIFDKDAVTEVMKILLRNHGLNLSGAKADLYTAIGLDSKHPSGIPSTIWKNASILSDQEAKALKDEYFAELQNSSKAKEDTKKDTTAAQPATDGNPTSSKQGTTKPKLKSKKKDDFFASGDEGEDTTQAPTEPTPVATKSKPKPKKKAVEMFASDDDEAEVPQKKAPAKPPSKPASKAGSAKPRSTAKRPAKRRDSDEEAEDDEDEIMPKKKRGRV